MTQAMLRQLTQCKQKKQMAHTGLTPCQFEKWNCQMFINITKYKIVYK